mmetsp:Transcript_22162/g.34090  ORF Transcript_22162/g.34090 Transcript_22162/m.34090 type:complete len:506 (+) Transcript_22162:193-1710(+)
MAPRPHSPDFDKVRTLDALTSSTEDGQNVSIDSDQNSTKRVKTEDPDFATSISSITARSSCTNSLTKEEGDYAIKSFQKILQFPTVSSIAPDSGAYVDCANYIVKQLESLEIVSDIHILEESPESSPIVVGCWKGSDPTLPVILLNSHYDVVPVDAKDWTVPPFEGKRLNGKIYGRGTQDMKCVCIQYIEGIRKLHKVDPFYAPKRSIYLSFVPDEETGGRGMAAFLDSNLYKNKLAKQGIALALDEGLASETSTYNVFYGERLPWFISVTAKGPTGHGSRFIDHTAVGQLIELSQKALEFRQGQRALLGLDDHSNCSHALAAKKKKTLGDVTSLNITSLEAGVKAGDSYAYNCVPPVARCSMDIRIPPNTKPQMIADMLDMWCGECSSDPSQGYELGWSHLFADAYEHAATSIDKKINPWYGLFCNTISKIGVRIEPQIFPAATDSRFLRALGIRALGFSPMRNTEIMLHEVDEYIPEETFLEGIEVYVSLIRELGKQGKEIDV